ncbi:MAG: peptide-N-glycosidase F-related protein [Bacteroidia bacterium]
MKKYLQIGFTALFIITYQFSFASYGDTTHVITHNQVLMVTNPSTGQNPYPAWGIFSPETVKYRKVYLNLSYRCPTGQQCGEWDYLDYIYIRRKGGVDSVSKNMEVVRFITPYGNSFSQSWHAEWHIDITDYQMFLHDSVEIEYIHTGYETNVGRGWVVTLDFVLVEGDPVMDPISITQLWNGSFPFGNASNPIENYLTPITFTTDANTNIMRMRILQTGHGADNTNCAEFCAKARSLYLDSVLMHTKSIWKTCGTNPLYPQGGTWIYNRANWCPGAVVFPDIYDFPPVTGGSTHTLDINMQAYTATSPSANYVFGSQLIQYKNPVHANDASIEEINTPNNIFEYSRINPVCDNLVVQLRNNGTAQLTSAVIKYGILGLQEYTYNWIGSVSTNKSVSVFLNNYILPTATNTDFRIYLSSVNGVADEYPYDDTIYSVASIPQVFDTAFVFEYKTNNVPGQTYFKFWDHNNNIIYQVLPGSLTANTIYKDTLYLSAGCYRFTLYDSGNDGLTFWANPGQGTGYARFKNMSAVIVKSFNSDFGSEVSHNFLVDPTNIVAINEQANFTPSVSVYPNPTEGNVVFDIIVPHKQDLSISIYNSMGQLILRNTYNDFMSEIIEMNLGDFKNGIYFVKITSEELNVVKKVVLGK